MKKHWKVILVAVILYLLWQGWVDWSAMRNGSMDSYYKNVEIYSTQGK